MLVHGLGAASDALVPIAAVLASRYDVHVSDLPGYGRSPAPERLGPADLADALAAWVRVLGLAPAAFLGNSAGCQILLHLAVRQPDVVERLCSRDPPSTRGHALAARPVRSTDAVS